MALIYRQWYNNKLREEKEICDIDISSSKQRVRKLTEHHCRKIFPYYFWAYWSLYEQCGGNVRRLQELEKRFPLTAREADKWMDLVTQEISVALRSE